MLQTVVNSPVCNISTQIEDSEGRITDKEREFFIHPHVGTTYKVKGVTRETPFTGGSVELMQEWFNFGKKPFDWMKDDQWKRLLVSIGVSVCADIPYSEKIWQVQNLADLPKKVIAVFKFGGFA